MPENTALAVRSVHALFAQPGVKNEMTKAIPAGSDITADRIIRIATTAIQKTPKLRECEPISVLACVMQAAAFGFEPNTELGECYLVGFKSSKTQKTYCSLIIGYKGFTQLAHNTGLVGAINSELVRKGEPFNITLGTSRGLKHVPDLDLRATESDRPSNWTGVYSTITYLNGHIDFEYLTAAQVQKFRNRSRSKDDGPWVSDTEAMWKKTAVRRLTARVPKSTTPAKLLGRAVALDEAQERGAITYTAKGLEENYASEEVLDVEPMHEAPADTEPQRRSAAPPPAAAAAAAKPAKKGKATRPAKPAPAAKGFDLPKANIPPMNQKAAAAPAPKPAAAAPPAKAKEEPCINSKQFTDLANTAGQTGWKWDEFTKYLKEKLGIVAIQKTPASRLPELMVIARGEHNS